MKPHYLANGFLITFFIFYRCEMKTIQTRNSIRLSQPRKKGNCGEGRKVY